MISWHKQKYILIIIISIVLGKQGAVLAKQGKPLNLTLNTTSTSLAQNSPKSQPTLLAQNIVVCQKLNPDYREIYSFETEEFYISVCQQGSSFYYHRQSKFNKHNTLLIPAQSAYGGDVFQATAGKTMYFVGKNGDRYYSSVMENSSEIVFEPEIQPATVASDAMKTTTSSSSLAVSNVEIEDTAEAGLKLDSPNIESFSSQSLVCTRQSSAFHPRLDGWQKLIGKSPDTANQYAVNNGHNFVYDGDAPDEALIKTKEGAIINLDIAAMSETIDRVCVQPRTEKQ